MWKKIVGKRKEKEKKSRNSNQEYSRILSPCCFIALRSVVNYLTAFSNHFRSVVNCTVLYNCPGHFAKINFCISSPIFSLTLTLCWPLYNTAFLVAGTRLYTTFLNSERYCSCPTVRDLSAVYPALFLVFYAIFRIS